MSKAKQPTNLVNGLGAEADVIFYTAENLWDWSEAAQHFVVKIPNLKGPWVGGFKALGLRSPSLTLRCNVSGTGGSEVGFWVLTSFTSFWRACAHDRRTTWLPSLAEYTPETSDFWEFTFKINPESVGARFRICSGTSPGDLDHICIVPSRSIEEQETKLARAIFLVAVPWLICFAKWISIYRQELPDGTRRHQRKTTKVESPGPSNHLK